MQCGVYNNGSILLIRIIDVIQIEEHFDFTLQWRSVLYSTVQQRNVPARMVSFTNPVSLFVNSCSLAVNPHRNTYARENLSIS